MTVGPVRQQTDVLTVTPLPVGRPPVSTATLAVVGGVVFVANAGLLVLQLLAVRLLVPFIGSSLETWTTVIGVFLAGIAAGNWFGGRLADRSPSARQLAGVLLLGSLTSLALLGWPYLFDATGWHRGLPLGVRIPVLAALTCFPPGFALSLLTPLAIRLGLPNPQMAGRAAGRVFALGTLGCLAGNYLTGFVLIPHLTLDAIGLAVAGVLAVAAVVALRLPTASRVMNAPQAGTSADGPISFARAAAVVFVCSFCGMALELTATRMLAQMVGVSLYTWTGVIGVMLAGTAVGNWIGGRLAEDLPRLVATLVVAAGAVVFVLVMFFALGNMGSLRVLPIVPRIVSLTFLMFFPPMVLLGMVSPQVIRLTVSDVSRAGRTVGRVYAWSTAGAILGTFATGYVLLSAVGMYRLLLVLAGVLAVLPVLIAGIEDRLRNFATAGLLGLILAGTVILGPDRTRITAETNYFTLRVFEAPSEPGLLQLQQDMLVHSMVKLDDPTYLHYQHERIQMQLLWHVARGNPRPNVLVIGGGGYTFPRAARTHLPGAAVDVVEIDPGVTAVSYSHLGLDPRLGIVSHHMDGRQFVAERAAEGHYHLMMLDAVNDFSVPGHLLTHEFHTAVKRSLAPNGVYLVTVIDPPEGGRLWKAALHTLRKTFRHVELLTYHPIEEAPQTRSILILYASDVPFDAASVSAAGSTPMVVYRADERTLSGLLATDEPLVLTDQFAPVDNLMSGVFRTRE